MTAVIAKGERTTTAVLDVASSAQPPLHDDRFGLRIVSLLEGAAAIADDLAQGVVVSGDAPAVQQLPVLPRPVVEQRGVACQGALFSGSPVSLAYRWFRDGAAIAGATSATYTPVRSDVGRTLGCAVDATNAYGSARASSDPILVGVNPAAPSGGKPALNPGDAKAGETLECERGTWKPLADRYEYAWLREGEVVEDATESQFTTDVDDAGTAIRCVVVATNAQGSSPAVKSAATVLGRPLAGVTVPDAVIVRGDAFDLRVRCMGDQPCAGTTTVHELRRTALQRRRASKPARWGRRRFSIPAGRSRTVRITLTRGGRAALRRRGRVRVTATTALRSGGERVTIQRAVTLRAPRR